MTEPSPEQNRRGKPFYATPLLLPGPWRAPAASGGEARADAVFKDCPTFSVGSRKGSGIPRL